MQEAELVSSETERGAVCLRDGLQAGTKALQQRVPGRMPERCRCSP